MATVKQHYAECFGRCLFLDVRRIRSHFGQETLSFLKSSTISVQKGSKGIAIDLGAGCGFQSIPLARLGFTVTAIDLDEKLLDELQKNSGEAWRSPHSSRRFD